MNGITDGDEIDFQRRRANKAEARADKLAALLRTALADLTGVRAGRLTPDQLQAFLEECKSALASAQPKETHGR